MDVGSQQPTWTVASIPDPSPSVEEVKLTAKNEQSKHAYSSALATDVGAEAAVASSKAVAAHYSGKSNEKLQPSKYKQHFEDTG